MSIKPLILSTLLCALPLLTSAAAVAQENAVSPEQAQVRTAYRKALAEMEKGNWQAAQALLMDLWKKSPTYDVAGSLGEAESRLGHHARAAQFIAFALKNVPPKEKADTSARLRAALDELRPRVGTLRLSVNRQAAEILVDAEQVGTYPQLSELYLSPGKHTVEARAGAESAKREVQAAVGASAPLSLEFRPEPIDSGLVKPSSPTPTPTSPAPASPARQENSPNWLPTYVTGGLAVVALGIGTGFSIDALKAKSDGDDKLQAAKDAFGTDRPCASGSGGGTPLCDNLKQLRDRRDSSNSAATVSFVVGGVVAAAAVGSYFLWARPTADSGRSARVGGWIGKGGGSLLVEGSF
jgi:hypothetical protein